MPNVNDPGLTYEDLERLTERAEKLHGRQYPAPAARTRN